MAATALAKGQELGTLVVVALKARNLPDKHTFTKQDPYAIIQLSSLKEQTSIDKRGGQHPIWDQEFRLKVSTDARKTNRTLKVSCFSKEPKEDYLIGEGEVDIAKTLESGEFDDWVQLTSNNAYRGEVYLEMTFFALGPAPLSRRASKLPPKERLWRPPQTPPKTPPQSDGHLAPPSSGYSSLPLPSHPQSAQHLSPHGRDDSLPPVPGGIPGSLRPTAGHSQNGPSVGQNNTSGPSNVPIPSILRPGGPSRPVAGAQHRVSQEPTYGAAPTPLGQHYVPPAPSHPATQHHTPVAPAYTSVLGLTVPFVPEPIGSGYHRRASAGEEDEDNTIALSFPEPAMPTAGRTEEERLAQRYGSPMPLPSWASPSRRPPQAHPPARAHAQNANLDISESSYLERERAALERARMEEADAEFARRLATEDESEGVVGSGGPPLPPRSRSRSRSQEEADEELARRLARELNQDVLNERRQEDMPGGWR